MTFEPLKVSFLTWMLKCIYLTQTPSAPLSNAFCRAFETNADLSKVPLSGYEGSD